MKDFTYIDAETESILVVCIAFADICEADYHFKDVVGTWPWKCKYVYTKSEPTCLQYKHDSQWYIPE